MLRRPLRQHPSVWTGSRRQASTPEDFGDDSDLDFSAIGLTEDEGNEIYDAFESSATSTSARSSSNSLDAEQSLSDEDRECVEEAFDDDLIRRMMVADVRAGRGRASNRTRRS